VRLLLVYSIFYLSCFTKSLVFQAACEFCEYDKCIIDNRKCRNINCIIYTNVNNRGLLL